MPTRTTTTATTGPRCVPSQHLLPAAAVPFETSPEALLADLLVAYRDARRHKRRKDYQLKFEQNMAREFVGLRDAILQGRYRPRPSSCFIIHDPKMREVFAAQFRDRVVHHLLYNYIAPVLEKGFIEDSYSCIKGRGTHYGIRRQQEKNVSVSRNYSRPCHILKMDISGYFMHIDRARLLEICLRSLAPFAESMDFPLVAYLLRTIVLDDPVKAFFIHRRAAACPSAISPPNSSATCI